MTRNFQQQQNLISMTASTSNDLTPEMLRWGAINRRPPILPNTTRKAMDELSGMTGNDFMPEQCGPGRQPGCCEFFHRDDSEAVPRWVTAAVTLCVAKTRWYELLVV